MFYSSRTEKNDPEGNSEIIRLTTPTIDPRSRLLIPWLQRVGYSQRAVGVVPSEAEGVTTPLRHAGDAATPVNLEGRASNQRGYS